MTGRDDPRLAAFEKAQAQALGRWNRLRADSEEDVERLIAKALAAVQARLQGPMSDWQAHHLPALERQMTAALSDLAGDLGDSVSSAATTAWAAGVETMDGPLTAAGLGEVATVLPRLDRAQLMAARSVLTDRMAGVGKRAVERVNAQLAFVAMGARDPAAAVTEITTILGESARKRALVITRTELGRVYSTASQARQEQARASLPGLRKQWRRSGKIESRRTHDLADGQIVDVDKPFLVGGTAIMHPRHPDAPAEHSVNCGCLSLPYMASWEVRNPGRLAVSDAEKAGSAAKRDLDGIHDGDFKRWSGWIADGKLKPAGSWEPVAEMPGDLVTGLGARGVDVVSPQIAVSDRRVAHMLRDKKPNRLPPATVRSLPALMNKPEAIYHAGTTRSGQAKMVYVVPVAGQADKVGRVFVTLRHEDSKSRHRRHNYIVSGDMVSRDTVAGAERGGVYDLLSGGLKEDK